MRRLIHLRGTNGVGKTTAVLQFIERGEFTKEVELIGENGYEYHRDASRNIVVLGRYGETTCGGIDGRITDKEVLKNVVAHFLKKLRPTTFVFEGVLYGVTFRFGDELRRICEALGYEYVGVCLTTPLETAIERVIKRSGNAGVDIMSIQSKYFSSLRAYQKMKATGAKVELIDTSNIDYGCMYRIIQERL